jgi:hypothetical protein
MSNNGSKAKKSVGTISRHRRAGYKPRRQLVHRAIARSSYPFLAELTRRHRAASEAGRGWQRRASSYIMCRVVHGTTRLLLQGLKDPLDRWSCRKDAQAACFDRSVTARTTIKSTADSSVH